MLARGLSLLAVCPLGLVDWDYSPSHHTGREGGRGLRYESHRDYILVYHLSWTIATRRRKKSYHDVAAARAEVGLALHDYMSKSSSKIH